MIKAYIVVNVSKPKQIRRQLARSFTRRMLELLQSYYAATDFTDTYTAPSHKITLLAIKTIDGSNRAPRSTMATQSGGGDDRFGIVVGDGVAAVTWDDYNLVRKIPHSATGLSYGPSSLTAIIDEPNGGSFRIIRTFTNNSSSNISITEVGLIVRFHSDAGVNTFALIARDQLSTPVVIAPGGTATFRYIIRVVM